MNGVNILLVCVALFGFLPLAVFLYRKKRADRILTTGRTARATVYYTSTSIKGNYEIVNYYFIAPDGKQYKGKLMTRPGLYSVNETIEVYYLPENPKANTVKGSWKSTGFLIFMILIAVAVVFMMYKVYEMINKE